MPTTKAVGQLGVIPLKTFEFTGRAFKNVKMDNLRVLAENIPLTNSHETLWMYAMWLNLSGVPEWKGFMESIRNMKIMARQRLFRFFSSMHPHLIMALFTPHYSMQQMYVLKLIRGCCS